MKLTELQDYRRKVLTHCRKLAIRCGGLPELRARSDDCAKYLEHCIAAFRFTENELEANEKEKMHQVSTATEERYAMREDLQNQGNRFVSVQEIAASFEDQFRDCGPKKSQVAEENSADACSGIWGISNVSEIGSRLLEQAQLELVEQDYRRNNVILQGMDSQKVKNAMINFDLTIMTKEEVAAHRETVLEQCDKLSKRCGGFAKLLLRVDDCPKFVQFSIDRYSITPDESGKWM